MIIETVVETLLEETPASRSGEYISSDVIVPANAPDGSLLRFWVLQADADRINPDVGFQYNFERRLAPNWLHMCGGTWTGIDVFDQEYDRPYSPICYVAIVTGVGNGQGGRTTRNKRGWRVRGRLVLPQTTVVGVKIDLVTQE